jgi:hypothetical protein
MSDYVEPPTPELDAWVARAIKEKTKRVLDAWRNEGSHPLYHRRMKAKLAAEWPSLHNALVELDRESD